MNPLMMNNRVRGRNLRRLNRKMKQDSGQHTGGGTPTPTQSGDNAGGNGGESQQQQNGGDNAGQPYDYSQFWSGSAGGNDDAAPSGESTGNATPPAGQQQQQQESQAPNLRQQIDSLDFGKNIMSADIMAELAEGKTENFHNQMNQFGRQAVERGLSMMIPIVRQVRDELRAEFKDQLGASFESKDSEAALLKAIPSAADPAVRPTVDSIFERAMKITKGNREAALGMTKDMLRLQSEKLGGDIGLPPRSAGDNMGIPAPSNTNWLEELAGR